MTTAIYIAHTLERSKHDVRFSILCLLHYSKSIRDELRIVVVSDHPEWFDDLPVEVELIDQAKVVEWKGEYDFLHRLKIEAIKHVRDHYDGDLLYMDGDTCFFKDVGSIVSRISKGKSIMHELEGRLEDKSNLTLKRTYDFFSKNRAISSRQGELAVPLGQPLYNAGVIGISREDVHVLEKVLAYNDALYPLYRNHVCEQLMFSHVLEEETTISECNDAIYHWWGRAQQTGALLQQFFAENNGRDLENMSSNAHRFVDTLKTAEKDRMTFFQNLGRSIEKRRKRIKMYFKR